MTLATQGNYEVEGCKEYCGYIEGGQSEENAQFFGVYFRQPPDPKFDGHRFAIHIADFDDLDDAVEYAEFKHNQDI